MAKKNEFLLLHLGTIITTYTVQRNAVERGSLLENDPISRQQNLLREQQQTALFGNVNGNPSPPLPRSDPNSNTHKTEREMLF